MITRVPELLDELCVKLGLCLSPGDRARLSVATPPDIEGFANAVLEAEGVDLVTVPRRLRHDLEEHVARYFVK